MAERLTDIAYAKLNLALHVRRRRGDGYHDIETLFAFLDKGDLLSVTAAEQLSLAIEGPFAADLSAGSDNLVLRAADALQQALGIECGAAFTLTKRLPVAAGIGGGSADAAAALRLAAKLWGVAADDARLSAVASMIGADVPACLAARTCFGTGLGTELTPLDPPGVSGAPALLVNPLVACPTGPVFAAWDGADRGALDPLQWRQARNDLEAAAIAAVPEISEVLVTLRAQLPLVARMSGSGATCFALFDTGEARDAAARRIAADRPDWWLMTGALR